MALLGSSLQGQLSGFQFSVHPDQDKNQGTPLSPWRTKGVWGTVRRKPLRSPLRAAVFSFSVFRGPLGPTGPKTEIEASMDPGGGLKYSPR